MGVRLNALVVRLMSTDLLNVRIALDPPDTGSAKLEPSSLLLRSSRPWAAPAFANRDAPPLAGPPTSLSLRGKSDCLAGTSSAAALDERRSSQLTLSRLLLSDTERCQPLIGGAGRVRSEDRMRTAPAARNMSQRTLVLVTACNTGAVSRRQPGEAAA
jgi:hypothetical protein